MYIKINISLLLHVVMENFLEPVVYHSWMQISAICDLIQP